MIIGIDLGTTNCAVGVWREGKAELIPNSHGHLLTPSAVGLDDKGDLLVGLGARERLSTHPKLTGGAFKRYMGTERVTKLGKKSFTPEELSAAVLRSLKADAEAFLKQSVTEAVITVPAYFNDKQRKATRRAGELAGLKVERLLNEPTAAALAYGIHERDKESRILVFDLGGGTFDVSVLEVFEGIIEVRASTGDNRLGGEDFNEVLIEMMVDHFDKDLRGDDKDDALRQKLRLAAERARRGLTTAPEATMLLIWKEKSYEFPVTADAFEERAAKLINRLREPVLRSLRDSNIRADSLDQIVLVGGATRMPIVRKAVTKMFGRFPAANVNPDEAVAMGAAIQAGLKARDAALDEVVLTDVCPYSLGVEVAEPLPGGGMREGIFSPILERNTVIPASRVQTYHPLRANQRVLELKVYQGESRHVVDNIFLGKLNVPLPLGKPGDVWVECRFTYDINGLLEVDVHVLASGEKRQLLIVGDESMPAAEIEKRRAEFAKLKVHPRDADQNQALTARANRCYEGFLGDKRLYIGQLISDFEAALDTQDPHTVEEGRQALIKALDAVDGETFL